MLRGLMALAAVAVPSLYTEESARRPDIPDGANATVEPMSFVSNGIDITKHLDGSANAPFPPRSWLGFGLDMTSVTPMDIRSVASNVLTASRVIKLQEGGQMQEMAGTSWLVPKGVIADPTTADGIDSSRSFENGEDAAKALSGDSSLAANYMAVTGNVAASYAVSKTFQRNYQYFLFAHNHVRIHVELDNYQGAVDEELLLRRLRRMNRWDPRSQATIEQYRTLFRTIGTHIIVSADYGGRLQLNTWADNSDSQVNQNFELDVGAQYNGLTTGGKVDVDVKGSSQFSKFQHSLQKLSSCRGGDPKLSARLSANPGAIDVWETFKKWANSADTVPNVMSFQTTLLSDIITNAANDQLAAYGVQVQRAYDYLVENPVHHLTLARMSITSDWGEIGLLTPSAYIRKTEGQADVDGLVYSTTKVTWALGAGLQREKLIEFYISNDGSPVDISLSHGSIGAPGKTGKIEVRFAEKTYVNEENGDNLWNSKIIYACPVNPHGVVRISRK